MFVLLM